MESPYFGEFQQIPMDSNVCLCYSYIILKKVHEQGLNHSLGECHLGGKQQYIHKAMDGGREGWGMMEGGGMGNYGGGRDGE